MRLQTEVWSMTGAGVAALAAGFFLVQRRVRAASGADEILVFGPVLEAGALAIFAAEHLMAGAVAGMVVVALTLFVYLPIFAMEFHTGAAVEGINYVGNTLLFAATLMLAGWGAEAFEQGKLLA